MEKKNYLTSRKKTELVIAMLRGEDIELLSRKNEITVSELSQMRNSFMSNGENGFKRNPEQTKLQKAERLIGQLQMELELTKKKNELIRKRNGK